MLEEARSLVERLQAALALSDLDTVVSLYADDAEVVRYDGAAVGSEQIRGFYIGYLATHGRYDLDSIVEFRCFDDVVLWDSMVATDGGILMTYDVAILNDVGLIVRHVPTIRGYWGR